ncbi:Nose resistant to fluoxetine protein 6-like protein [Leptotrombidium deliense]|uniref:Nose resistant to fluoxetine protein 6-like protein n=1 Tax=Leptotrombidium deliense TaxID=299467 RepID=A0A443SNX8_9ACAR|nr:Nose resistant to fluoxetine protein 6-like protein [Leptotrombidium deliense]
MASIVSTGIVTYFQHISPTLLFANPDPISRKTYGNKMLIKPYPHAACYLIGILTGYLLANSSQIKIRNVFTYIGWLFSTVVCFSALLITWQWNKGHTPTPIVSAIYAAFSRTVWSLAMSWIVYACYLGRGGIVHDVLCWSVFRPLSKISYMAYLIHPGLMIMFVGSTRSIFTFSHFLIFSKRNESKQKRTTFYCVNESGSFNSTITEKPAFICEETFRVNNDYSLSESNRQNLNFVYDYKL